ncbi:MAG: T9SS type A sorting domain-containing protein [Bacteroidales bacterium]|nr:T9SS type A sorting domain-containing protein [Bacteroidales bacterium]
MKKLFLTFSMMFCLTALVAQEEHIINFNDYTIGTQCLNGQDNWSTHYQTAGTSQDFDIDYTGDGLLSPDETVAVFYPYGGAGVGRTATRKTSENFGFNFKNGGIIDLEFDIYPAWWGDYVGVGFDADGDGHVLQGMTEGDGGVYLRVAGSGNDRHPNIMLPNGTDLVIKNYRQESWARYKMSFDFSAYDGAGSLTVFVKDFDGTNWTEWKQLSEATELNMGMTPGSGDMRDYKVWDAVFFHCQGGTGGFDNILVRQMPEGNMQYINMPDVPKQLTINPPYTLEATTTSGLPVSFELISGPATIEGNVLTLTGETGTVSLKATQAGNNEWLAAPDVVKTFEVIDHTAYPTDITIRRPYNETNVYLPELKAIVISTSLKVEHADALHFEEVTATINGEENTLNTIYPDDPENGYYYCYWTPSQYGEHTMTISVTTTGGNVTEKTSTFTITNEYEDIDVVTFDGDLECTPQIHSAKGNYVMPTHVGAFSKINAHYDHKCINRCDDYDRVGGVKVRNYRGEWMELFRYTTPFGKECEDNIDVTDYTSVLQGLVEIELYFESWNGDGYNPTLTFNLTKGDPEYDYANVEELWFDIYAFGDYRNQQPVPKVKYFFQNNTEAAKLKLTTTGHNWSSGANGTFNTGNAAEFYEATHNININGEKAYEQHLWRQCNPNPAGCQPQDGTWPYNRSGWCPGSIAMTWDFDLTKYLTTGYADLFYEFDPAYLDECHPNHPNCVNGFTCEKCDAPDNPVLRVSGKIISLSNTVEVLTDVPTLVEKETFNVDIFPNPAKATINFSSDYEHGKLSVLIVNAQGQEVRRFTFAGSRSIDVSDLTSGVYFVKILGNTMQTKKIVIR